MNHLETRPWRPVDDNVVFVYVDDTRKKKIKRSRCPWCKSVMGRAFLVGLNVWQATCANPKCRAKGPEKMTREAAENAWDRQDAARKGKR